ncbi:LacI family DNA-binding transcriptional regulator [Anaeromicrobium sediminis]|uniref:LacI family transcriptional regulator n=1 Tax=Anaeromicrobium sediminis TaxID=1478221 RepID=A0A267MJE3_9FIRM|nr:LacI family DNA-binding transcriptional regulator [Anaeromicrobium sediminis]PAB59689.1 LacI family transcriptional regulator [Anaeromicrobium sediminis]
MKALNIKDIAKLAGVGVSTVSRVLNDHPDVKAATREKVLKVIDEVNYIPNNSARNLKRSNSKNIGVLVKGIYNPFFAELVNSIEKRIDEEGYSMILHYNDDVTSDLEGAIQLIKEKKLQGLICLGGDFNDLKEDNLVELNTPLVLSSININDDVDKEKFSSVIIENEKSSYDAVEYLCKLGHEHIGIITTGEGDTNVGQLRHKGYKRALREYDIDPKDDLVEFGDYSFKSGFEAMNKLLDRNENITAVFAISDIMAIGAAKAILSRGYKIPEDISIIGFDGLEFGEYFHPSITTVKQPREEMGEKSIEILMNLIKGKKEQEHIVLKTELLERESCKKVR